MYLWGTSVEVDSLVCHSHISDNKWLRREALAAPFRAENLFTSSPYIVPHHVSSASLTEHSDPVSNHSRRGIQDIDEGSTSSCAPGSSTC